MSTRDLRDLRRIIAQGQRRVFTLCRRETEELRRIYRLARNDVAARLRYLEQYEDRHPILLAQTRQQLEALTDTWRELGRQTGPVYLRAVDRALRIGGATAERFAARAGLTFALIPHDAALILHQAVLDLAGDVTAELAQRVRGEVVRGILAGESVSAVRRRVVGRGLTTKGTPFRRAAERAETIVRTETVRAFNLATVERWRYEREIVGYQWDAVLDYRTCDACAALHGQYWPKGEERIPPDHPNCRCALLPVTRTYGRYDIEEVP